MNTRDPGISEELEAFRSTVRKFIAIEVAPNRQRWRQQRCVDRQAWIKAGQAGLLGASIPMEYGGGGGTFRHETVIMEEFARIGFLDFYIPLHNAIVAPYFVRFASPAQRERWLPTFSSGECILGIAMTEPGTGSDLQAIRTTARRDGSCYVIHGQKSLISNGQSADLILVAAKTDPSKKGKGISLLVVEPGKVEGFRRGRTLEKAGLHAQDTAELFFDDVRVPEENLLGEVPGQGFAQLMDSLPQERLVIAVQAVASMVAALDETISYVKGRTAFNERIFDFQNTRFVLAECATATEIGKAFVEKCVAQLVDGQLDPSLAAMAKLWTTEQQFDLVDRCLQLFGGYGYLSEYPISQMWADARVQRIFGGTSEIMKELIGRSL